MDGMGNIPYDNRYRYTSTSNYINHLCLNTTASMIFSKLYNRVLPKQNHSISLTKSPSTSSKHLKFVGRFQERPKESFSVSNVK